MSDTGRDYEVRIRGCASPELVAGVAKLDVLPTGDLVLEDSDGACVGIYARGEWISAVAIADEAGE